MGVKTVVLGQDKTFKPIVLNVQITIDDAKSLKELKRELRIADIDQHDLVDGDNEESLPLISGIVQIIEEAL